MVNNVVAGPNPSVLTENDLHKLKNKESCRFATDTGDDLTDGYTYDAATGTITKDASDVVTIDSGTIALNDRILVKNQTTGQENGIYTVTVVGTSEVALVLTRSLDCDSDTEVTSGMFVHVEEGTANADKNFALTTNSPTLGTDALVFTNILNTVQEYNEHLQEIAGLNSVANLTQIAGLTSVAKLVDTLGVPTILHAKDDGVQQFSASSVPVSADLTNCVITIPEDGLYLIVIYYNYKMNISSYKFKVIMNKISGSVTTPLLTLGSSTYPNPFGSGRGVNVYVSEHKTHVESLNKDDQIKFHASLHSPNSILSITKKGIYCMKIPG